MVAKDAEAILANLYAKYPREVILLQLEDTNGKLNTVIQKLRESATLSGLRLRQTCRLTEGQRSDEEQALLEGHVTSLQFYDIITQKLDHLLRANSILIEELKIGIKHSSAQLDAASFMIIFPELMQLHWRLLVLVRDEYASEIDQLNRQFGQKGANKDAVDLQLDHYRDVTESTLNNILDIISAFKDLPASDCYPDLVATKCDILRHIVSMYTMNSEREAFRTVFSEQSYLNLLPTESTVTDSEGDVELF